MDRDEITFALTAVDLNLLVALDALLQEHSVTRAGVRLGLTQSATSAALARLRDLFDDDLLVRHGREMRPTPVAEALQLPVREALVGLEHILNARTNFDPRRDARTFTVAAADYTSLVLMPPLIERINAQAPHVKLRVRSADVGNSPARLERGEVDVAVMSSFQIGMLELPSMPLFRDRFVAAAWHGAHDLPDVLSLEALRHLPYLSFRIGELPPMVERRLSELGAPLDPAVVIDNFTTGAHLLRGTGMVTFLQRRAAHRLAEGAELRVLDASFELPELVETMWWHPRSDSDAGHRWLRTQIIAAAHALGD